MMNWESFKKSAEQSALSALTRTRSRIIISETEGIGMKRKSIPLTMEKKKKISKIYQHPTESGFCYSVYLVDKDEVLWCDTLSEVYQVIEKI